MEAPTVTVKGSEAEEVKFFGEVDINKHGNVGSEMPSWYFRTQNESLDNDIQETEQAISRGEIREDKKPEILADLAKMKEKREKIKQSQAELTPYEDAISKMTKTIGKKIAEAMFTRTDMMRGTADAHDEARRMAYPCIKLEGDELLFAKKANCKIDKNGMVSRDDASRMWKMGRRALGENSNIEILRKG